LVSSALSRTPRARFHRPRPGQSRREKARSQENSLASSLQNPAAPLEPNIFKQYFYERIRQKVGDKEVGSHFIAVTDPGSKMEQVAKDGGFPSHLPRRSQQSAAATPRSLTSAPFPAPSWLGPFEVLKITHKMVKACGPATAPEKNPGVILGTILGVAANHGRDKITIFTSPGISDAGAWLEQLIADLPAKSARASSP